MQEVVNHFNENPLLGLLAAASLILALFWILKSILRISLFLLVLFALYVGYLHFFEESGQPVIDAERISRLKDHAYELIPQDLNLSLSFPDSNFTRPHLGN